MSNYSLYFRKNSRKSCLNTPKKRIDFKNSKNKIDFKLQKKHIKKIFFLLISVFGFLGFCFAIIWVFFSSPIFRIKNIAISIENESYIEPVKIIIEEQTKTERFLFKQSNIFIFSKEEAIDSIVNNFDNYLYDIKILKIYPNKIRINLKERSSKILFISPKTKAYYDENGIVIYKSDNIQKTPEKINKDNDNKEEKEINVNNLTQEQQILESSSYPTVFIDENVILDNNSIKKEKINFILNLLKKLSKNIVKVQKVKIETLEDDKLVILTDKNYEIYFNMSKDYDQQINYLNIVLKEKIGGDVDKIQYIDLRFDSKIFYK